MKATNLTKRIFACGMAIALVLTGSVFVTQPALAAKKAKAPKLSKKKATITVGKTLKLSVKKATKKVKWSTSNKKVAKIQKTTGKKKAKAVIKGIKAGKATITAKVKGKKLKCKVTVKKKIIPTNISSVSVDSLDSSSVVLQLKEASALNAADVKIDIKKYKNGKFNKTISVKTLTSTDQSNWRLYLSDGIPYGYWIKVTIGKNTKTVQNVQEFYGEVDNSTILLRKDAVVNDEYNYALNLVDYFNNGIGTVKYELKDGTLPEGLTLSSKRSQIKGIPTTVGDSTVVVEATDEMNRKATTTLTIKVYDDTTIASADRIVDCRLDDYVADRAKPTPTTSSTPSPLTYVKEHYQEILIAPRGGSGQYTFALAAPADVAGVSLSTDKMDEQTKTIKAEKASSAMLYIPYGITEGVHTYTVNITDAADASRKCTAVITVNVSSYYNISGVVADIAGNMPQGDELYFIPKDAKSFDEYISQRTFIKYDLDGDRCGGNKPDDYSGSYMDSESDDFYSVYDHSYSAKIGPFPLPEIETEPSAEPTVAPAVESTGEPTDEPAPVVSAAPTKEPYKAPTVEAGKYTTELPAGEYIVKMYSEATDTFYQMDNTVTVGNVDAEAALTVPVRYANVSGKATYANAENPYENGVIYFEPKDSQYKMSAGYYARTNYRGEFSASLPAGTYVAYIYDEYEEKQYFTTDVVVGETAVSLTDFKLSITRYVVEGTLYRAVEQEAGEETVEPIKMDYQSIYFYLPDGTVKNVYTDEDGVYKVHLEGGSPAKTYTVRTYNWRTGLYHTLGSVSVGAANQTIKGNNPVNLTLDFAKEVAGAVQGQLGVATSFVSSGNNDMLVKYTPSEAGEYKIRTEYTNNRTVMTDLFDSDGQTLSYSTDSEGNEKIIYASLEAEKTYYFRVMPYVDYEEGLTNQTKGNISVTFTKVDVNEEYAGAVEITAAHTESAPLVVNTSKHEEKQTYVKLTAEANKSYTINLLTTTIGVDEIYYSVIGPNGYVYDSDYFYSNNGQFTITADEAGTYYIRLSSYDGEMIASTLKMSLAVADVE